MRSSRRRLSLRPSFRTWSVQQPVQQPRYIPAQRSASSAPFRLDFKFGVRRDASEERAATRFPLPQTFCTWPDFKFNLGSSRHVVQQPVQQRGSKGRTSRSTNLEFAVAIGSACHSCVRTTRRAARWPKDCYATSAASASRRLPPGLTRPSCGRWRSAPSRRAFRPHGDRRVPGRLCCGAV